MSSRVFLRNKFWKVYTLSLLVVSFFITGYVIYLRFTSNYLLKHESASADSMKRKICKPRKNIAFIKTHKTAGSAVQNILFRYGLKHELRFALPRNAHDFYYPQWFTKKMIVKFGSEPYNILCHHMRFHYERVRESMPDDTFFITSVREPGALFESTFFYFWTVVPAFQRVPHYGKHSLENWLNNAVFYAQQQTEEEEEAKQFTKNPTMFDLGYHNNIDDVVYIEEAINKLDAIFDLVIVADHFLESLVLLADRLCWNLTDVACFTINARSNGKYKELTKDEHERIRKKARKWNKADAALFDHFNASLWCQIDVYGRNRMAKDVDRLQSIIKSLLLECVEEGHSVEHSLVKDPDFKKVFYQPEDISMQSYNLKANAKNLQLCSQLIEGENHFGRKIYDYQKAKYPIPLFIEQMA